MQMASEIEAAISFTAQPGAVVDCDHRDAQSHMDPWPRWEEMRQSDSLIFYTNAHHGYFVLPGYREVADAARDAELFSSALNQTTMPALPTAPIPPIHTDPPEQRHWRELVEKRWQSAAA